MRKFTELFLIPIIFYLLFFILFTWPWASQYTTHFFGDAGDGLQNVWNVWWFHEALTHGQNPWFTTLLHYPHGTTLLGHTLTPINGLTALPLIPLFGLTTSYNILVTLAFVGSGLTAFWLCYSVSRSYIGSLLGGFIYTYSSYHFAHGIGHLNLITMQWLPLFILAWYHYMQKPSYRLAILATLALIPVLLTDYYYFLFSILTALVITAYFLTTKQLTIHNKEFWKSFGLFAALGLIVIAPLPLAVILAGRADPFLNSHNPIEYSIDLLSPFIAGEIWRFADLTKWFWTRDHLDIVEGSLNLGISTWLIILVAAFTIKKQPKNTALWLWLIGIFLVLSIGPRMHLLGNVVESIRMPYSLVVRLFPIMKLAGVPARMMIIVLLSASVIVATVLAKLDIKRWTSWLALTALLGIFCFEAWPARPYSTLAIQPQFVATLERLPTGGVLDRASSRTQALYYQTGYHKPMVEGYISRVPISVDTKDQAIRQLIDGQQYSALSGQYGIRYMIMPAADERPLPVLFQDQLVKIYDLGEL